MDGSRKGRVASTVPSRLNATLQVPSCWSRGGPTFCPEEEDHSWPGRVVNPMSTSPTANQRPSGLMWASLIGNGPSIVGFVG